MGLEKWEQSRKWGWKIQENLEGNPRDRILLLLVWGREGGEE